MRVAAASILLALLEFEQWRFELHAPFTALASRVAFQEGDVSFESAMRS